MPEAQSGTATQGATVPTPQGGTSPTPQGGAAPAANGAPGVGAAGGSSDQPSAAELAAANAELLRDNKKYRDRLNALEKAEKDRQDAALSDTEKVTARIAALEQQNKELTQQAQDRAIRASVVETAARLNFRSPEVAYRLLDAAAIEYREDGTPRNLERLLKDVLEKEPYLAKPNSGPDFGGGPRGKSPASGDNMNTLIRRAAGRA